MTNAENVSPLMDLINTITADTAEQQTLLDMRDLCEALLAYIMTFAPDPNSSIVVAPRERPSITEDIGRLIEAIPLEHQQAIQVEVERLQNMAEKGESNKAGTIIDAVITEIMGYLPDSDALPQFDPEEFKASSKS